METVVSGIRPTGNLHLGNYFGAVKSFLRMQDEYNCFFFIADWHSLTTHPHPDNIRNSVKTILSEYLACGIDPEKATIYIQSDVPEVVELYLYLNMNACIQSGFIGFMTIRSCGQRSYLRSRAARRGSSRSEPLRCR